ncbi:MAG: alpha/beta hydrolase [Acidimicrobiia bacterium]
MNLRTTNPIGDAVQSLVRELVHDGVPEPVPAGRRVHLEGRGTTYVRELPGPPGAPTLVLLHGWMGSGGLNWCRAFEPLGRDFRVLAPDLRGHGNGMRHRAVFRLADCADDLAALLDTLHTGPVVVAGYSMGGAIAQLLARQRPDLVAGMVLCATAAQLPIGPGGGHPLDAALVVAANGARLSGHVTHLPTAPVRLAAGAVGAVRTLRATTPTDFVRWAVDELRRHDVRILLEAARAAGRHDAREWIGEVRAPAAVVLTARDRLVPADRQLATAEALRASVHEVAGGHTVCTRDRFVGPLVDACHAVAG